MTNREDAILIFLLPIFRQPAVETFSSQGYRIGKICQLCTLALKSEAKSKVVSCKSLKSERINLSIEHGKAW